MNTFIFQMPSRVVQTRTEDSTISFQKKYV